MLRFQELSLRRGSRLLFQDVTLTIHAGWKLGVTGGNGSGKSSLLTLIRGELHADAGDFTQPPGLNVAWVAQETPAVDAAAIDYVMDGDRELRETQAALAQAERDDDGHRQANLHARLEAMSGYAARSRAGRLLHGLGFSSEDEGRPVRAFSGGWRMRLNLAQALMARSDLLLLDEPTNHLDLDATLWLEEWLRAYPGTLLLVSHDRDFLDGVADHVAHLEGQRVSLYDGNYSTFERRRAEMLAQQQATYEKQQREIAHVRAFVDRFRAKATKARQAQSRLKALGRMRSIALAHVDSPFHFAFPEPARLPSPLLSLEGVSAGYDARPVLNGVNLSLLPGDRIGLLGRNGAGKSTLIKLLAGELGARGGVCTSATSLQVGYFAQHQLEQLYPHDSPLAHLRRLNPGAPEQALRDFLGGFGFPGDMALAPVAPLSGGEKARLVLALLAYQGPNLLLFDEPTNHLDLEMRHALNVALQEFPGAMVLVSHDRHLLRSTADTLWLVAGGSVRPFEGDLDDYHQWLVADQETQGPADQEPLERGATTRREKRRQAAAERQRLQPLRAEVERLETALERLGVEKAALAQTLTDPALYEDSGKERLRALLLEQGRVDKTLGELEAAWLDASAALEGAGQN
jgi:ATP-binding cassette subfamily F protein 3